jgi:hypothetical protein
MEAGVATFGHDAVHGHQQPAYLVSIHGYAQQLSALLTQIRYSMGFYITRQP